MKSQFRAVNRYISKIKSTSSIDNLSSSGTFQVEDISVGWFTLPQGAVTLYVTADFAQTGKEEIFRIVDITGDVMTYDKRISVGGYVKPAHAAGASIRMNDVADILNEMSDNIDNFGDINQIDGTQTIKVWWGVFNNGGTVYNISSQTLIVTAGQLVDNTTNYIHFDITTRLFIVTASSTLAAAVCMASVVVAGWIIGTITDLRPGFAMTYGEISTKLDKSGGLRDTMGNALWTIEITSGWLEIKRLITSWTPSWTDLVQYINPSTRDIKESTYSDLVTSIASGIKYAPSVVLWEDIAWSTPTAVSVIKWNAPATIPFLTSDSGNPDFIASKTWLTGSAYTAFNNSLADWLSSSSTGAAYTLRIDMLTPILLWYGMTISWSTTSGADLILQHSGTGWTFTIQWSNDGTSWTTIYTSTGNDWSLNPLPSVVPAQTVAWLKYRLSGTVPSGSIQIFGWNFRYSGNTIQPITFSNTMGSNIGWARVKPGIRFSVPYNTTLATVKTSQVSTSGSARVQLFEDDWTTLVAEQTPASSDTVVFPNTPISANTIYRLVENDSTYFGTNNNELDLSTYQTWFKFTVSGTLNWSNAVLPQNITEVNLWVEKAMKSIANSTQELSAFAWFVVWPKSKWDLVILDSNEWGFIGWLSWLIPDRTYYVWNTAWVPSLSPGTIKFPIWSSMSTTEISISKRLSDTLVNLWNTGTLNHFWGMLIINFNTAGQVCNISGRSSQSYSSWMPITINLPAWVYKVTYWGTSPTSITLTY